jgi:hypothetical protein
MVEAATSGGSLEKFARQVARARRQHKKRRESRKGRKQEGKKTGSSKKNMIRDHMRPNLGNSTVALPLLVVQVAGCTGVQLCSQHILKKNLEVPSKCPPAEDHCCCPA